MQTKIHNGLLGGEVDELMEAAEQRAYHRAEALLTQLLTAAADAAATSNELSASL